MITLRDRPGVATLAAERRLVGERLVALLGQAGRHDPESDRDIDQLRAEIRATFDRLEGIDRAIADSGRLDVDQLAETNAAPVVREIARERLIVSRRTLATLCRAMVLTPAGCEGAVAILRRAVDGTLANIADAKAELDAHLAVDAVQLREVAK